MKHKTAYLIAAALALLLLASCGTSPAEAGETEPSSPLPSASAPASDAPQADSSGDPAYYSAYADIVREYRQQYGTEHIQKISTPVEEMNYLMGLCVVRLVDFDQDGTLELLLAWPESEEEYHSYRYAIWISPDGRTAEQICENQVYDGAMSYHPLIKLVERADGVFLGEDTTVANADEARVYRQVSAMGLSDVLALAYTPPFGVEEQYLVNGEAVGADDYAKAETDFLEGATVTRIDFVLSDFEDTTSLANTIQATQETLGLLGIEVDGTGGTIIDSTPSDKTSVNYQPYVDLIDQYLLEYGQPQILTSSRWDGRDDVPALGGLCVVRVMDMDGDGVDELILACAQKTAANGKQISYQYGVWTLRDGAADNLLKYSIPGTAYEPSMVLFADQQHWGVSYDTNTEEVTSVANVEYQASCYEYDGERVTWADSFAELPDDVLNNSENEWIYFSQYSYRWAYGMDWDEDSQRVLNKTLETINSLVGASY